MDKRTDLELEDRLVSLRLGSHRIEDKLAGQGIVDFNIPEHGWGEWHNLQFLPPIYECRVQSDLQSPEDDCMICSEVVCSALASSLLLKQLGLLGLQTMKEGGLVYWNMSGRIDGPTLKRLYEQLLRQPTPGSGK